MKKSSIIPLFSLAVLGMSGCVSSDNVDVDKNLKVAVEGLGGWDASEINNAQASIYLTDLVDIKYLDLMIENALDRNPNYKKTLLNRDIARLNVTKSVADAVPSVDLNLTSNKEESVGMTSKTSLGISWEIDIWDKLRDSKNAAKESLEQQELDIQYVRDVLVADMIREYLNASMYHQLIKTEESKLSALKSNNEFILSRFKKGLGSLEDLDSSDSKINSSLASIEGYKLSLSKSKRALALLMGGNENIDEILFLDKFPDVITPLSAFPKQDISNRPDVKSGYSKVKQQEYIAKVAYKDMFPSFSLSAALNDTASRPLDSLLVSPVWNLLGQLTIPVFQGGKLKAATEIENLEVKQTLFDYRNTVLNAYAEVQNSLDSERSFTKQEGYIANALVSTNKNEDNYTAKYQRGLVTILDLISVQTAKYDLESNLINIKHQKLINRINLGLALGLGVKNVK